MFVGAFIGFAIWLVLTVFAIYYWALGVEHSRAGVPLEEWRDVTKDIMWDWVAMFGFIAVAIGAGLGAIFV